MKDTQHTVYILKCADDTLYTGYTIDLARRVKEHNSSKKGARYTKGRRPVACVYTEEYDTRGKALRREATIKKMKKDEKIDLVAGGKNEGVHIFR